MAGVISPSMMVYVVENKTHGNRAYSGLNEGYGKVLRMGAYAPEVIAQPALDERRDGARPGTTRSSRAGGIDMRALLGEALHMGDEGHNRNKAASLLFLKALAPQVVLAARRTPQIAAEILKFLGDNRCQRAEPDHGRRARRWRMRGTASRAARS